MLNLIHITTIPQTFGFLKGQMRTMQRWGLTVGAITSPASEDLEKLDAEDFPTTRVPMRRAISPIADLIAIFYLVGHLRRIRPAIVHAHTPKAGLLGMLAATIARVPVRIYHLHGMRFQTLSGWRRWLTVAGDRLACSLATQVLSVGNSVRQAAIEEGIVNSENVKVLGYGSIDGVDATERFNPARQTAAMQRSTREELGFTEDSPILGFVGRLVVDKGVVELADAWSTLRAQFPSLHLIIVGMYDNNERLPSEVQKLLDDDPRITMVGHVTDIERYYAIMDVLCLPTYREGLPYALIEAAAMEVPVVATHVCGCVDAVVDGVTGKLVAPRDSSGMARALASYLTDTAIRRQHGMAARKRVLDYFHPSLVREQVYREYKRLADCQGISDWLDRKTDAMSDRCAA